MGNALQQILKRAELEGHAIGFDEAQQWSTVDHGALVKLGILRPTDDAEYVTCDACDDPHDAEVIPDCGHEPRIYCPDVGLYRIRADRLRQWEVDFVTLAHLLFGALGLHGVVQDVTPGRIWLLGRRQVTDRTAEFFLGHGLSRADSLHVLRSAARMQSSPAPIVFVPDRLPEHAEWRENGRLLLRLSEWAQLENDMLTVQLQAFEDLHRQVADGLDMPLEATPVSERDALIKRFCRDHNNCTVTQVCFWANVDRGDLSRWKNGSNLIPDGGERALRIERLLQRGYKTRTD